MLLSTAVLSQLDYVNSMLSRAPTTIIKPYKKFRILQPDWPIKSQKEKMLTCAYENCTGCPSNLEPHSNYLELYTILMEMLHNTSRRNYNENNFQG